MALFCEIQYSTGSGWCGVIVSQLALDLALGELSRFALIHLAKETISMHRLVQAAEQNLMIAQGRPLFLEWGDAAPQCVHAGQAEDVPTRDIWIAAAPRAETSRFCCSRHLAMISAIGNGSEAFANMTWKVLLILERRASNETVHGPSSHLVLSDFVLQKRARRIPPSHRSAAPFVLEASGLAS